MIGPNTSMKDVVAVLRRESVGALLELFELDVAVGELVLNAGGHSAALHEIAVEVQHLAETPGIVSPGKLRALAAYANHARATADAQARALTELKSGLNEWSIAG